MSLKNVINYTHNTSPTWLPKNHELNWNSTKRYADLERGKAHEASTLYKELQAAKKC